MTTCMVSYNDQEGSLVEVEYQCSEMCMYEQLKKLPDYKLGGRIDRYDGTSIDYGTWPCGSETDYDVHCSNCEQLLWKGLQHATD